MTREQFEDLRWSCGYTYLGNYGFAHIAILGSNSVEYGEDEDEIIMDEPEVLAIIR